PLVRRAASPDRRPRNRRRARVRGPPRRAVLPLERDAVHRGAPAAALERGGDRAAPPGRAGRLHRARARLPAAGRRPDDQDATRIRERDRVGQRTRAGGHAAAQRPDLGPQDRRAALQLAGGDSGDEAPAGAGRAVRCASRTGDRDAAAERAELPGLAASPGAGAAEGAGRLMAPVAELRDAAMRLGGRTLWDGLDVSVEAGEFLAVLGPNGAGKTTLLKVLLGLAELSGGSARVAGLAPQEGRERVGYVPQLRAFDRQLPLRGRDLVRLGFDGHRSALARSNGDARRAVAAALEAVGASAYADAPIGLLSGGEQQRLRIAQAL